MVDAMDSWNDVVRTRLRAVMNERGETVRSLAAKLGRSANWVQKRLQGITMFTLDEASDFTAALGLDWGEFNTSTRAEWQSRRRGG